MIELKKDDTLINILHSIFQYLKFLKLKYTVVLKKNMGLDKEGHIKLELIKYFG